MDEETLLNYPDFWSKESKQESNPKMENLTLLTEDELHLTISPIWAKYAIRAGVSPVSVVKSAIEKMTNDKNREKK